MESFIGKNHYLGKFKKGDLFERALKKQYNKSKTLTKAHTKKPHLKQL